MFTVNKSRLCNELISFFWILLSVLILVIGIMTIGSLFAGEVILPAKEGVLIQTNGPLAEFDDGDWWTNKAFGGYGSHIFMVEVPTGTNPNFVVEVELWDPECYSNDPQSLVDSDEQKWGAWENTTFTLYSPTHVQMVTKVYQGGNPTTNEKWVDFFKWRVGDYGAGKYQLEVFIHGDDENGYKIGLKNGDTDGNPANGDEIKLWAKRTSFQIVGQGQLFNTFWFKVPTGKSRLDLYNFDLEGSPATIRYVSPSGQVFTGTPSGDAVWNTHPPGTELPIGDGDVISHPEAGWWQAIIGVYHPSQYVRDGNQFIFWPNDVLFNGPPEVASCKIGDRVWIDRNMNGLQDAGEVGLAQVTVRLLNGNTDAVLSTTITDLNGNYSFDNVAPGVYRIEFQLPTNFFFTAQAVGSDRTIDSDPDPTTGRTNLLSLVPNQTNLDIDAGMIPKSVSNLRVIKTVQGSSNVLLNDEVVFFVNVTNDGPDDATQVQVSDNLPTGLEFDSALRPQDQGPNPLVWLENLISVGQTITYQVHARAIGPVGDYNNCAFVSSPNLDENLADNVSCASIHVYENGIIRIGDFVWNDLNQNGLQDSGETGMPNIIVQLLNGADESLVASTNTDPLGMYEFTNVPTGSYKLHFILPPNFQFTLANQGSDDAIDSDADPVSGKTMAFDVVNNTDYLNWDAGMHVQPPPENVIIGDTAWVDVNKNGLQDNGEPGRANVRVNLLSGATSALIAFTNTDLTGKYFFENIAPGSYKLEFIPPDGYHFTQQNQGSNDNKDSDVDPATGQTAVFNVVSNLQYLMWDAGLAQDDRSDLVVNKYIDGNRTYFYTGEEVEFILVVQNNGPDDAHDVVVTDHLPDGLQFLSATRLQDEGPNPLIWRESLIPVGGSVTYHVRTRSTETLGGMDNCVTATSRSTDPNVDNNIACVQVHILVPVELSSFTASFEKGQIILRWTTQSETENMGFHILRSESEQGAYLQTTKNIIPGAGNSSSVHHYEYIENDLLQTSKTYYYKLADIDYKGRTNIHGPVSVMAEQPNEYMLAQNYPNPFNPETRIGFTIKETGIVMLTVFNVKGERVRTLMSGRLNAGSHMVIWDGKDDSGNMLPSGLYIYTLRVNNYEEKRTMMFLK